MTITINGSTGITDADGGTVLNSNDLASQAQAETGTDNATLMTPLRTAQAISIKSGTVGIGTNQTWQTVSRTAGVAYQNTTGKPIMYTQSAYNSGTSSIIDLTASADNVTYNTVSYAKAGTAENPCVCAIIPNLWYYKTSNSTSSGSGDSARELK